MVRTVSQVLRVLGAAPSVTPRSYGLEEVIVGSDPAHSPAVTQKDSAQVDGCREAALPNMPGPRHIGRGEHLAAVALQHHEHGTRADLVGEIAERQLPVGRILGHVFQRDEKRKLIVVVIEEHQPQLALHGATDELRGALLDQGVGREGLAGGVIEREHAGIVRVAASVVPFQTGRVHSVVSGRRRIVRNMTLNDIELTTIRGEHTTVGAFTDKVVLVVNVASRCGLAPQYEKLEALQKEYGDKGFTVLGFPSNQFLQELGSEEAIAEYCSATWGVTFPMFEKVKVNGKNAHPLYKELTEAKDADGKAGKVKWNFEKFVITPGGEVHRFRPTVEPDDEKIVSLIESSLPAA